MNSYVNLMKDSSCSQFSTDRPCEKCKRQATHAHCIWTNVDCACVYSLMCVVFNVCVSLCICGSVCCAGVCECVCVCVGERVYVCYGVAQSTGAYEDCSSYINS